MSVVDEFTSRGFDVSEDALAILVARALDAYSAPGSTALTANEVQLLEAGGLGRPGERGDDVDIDAEVRIVTRSSARVIAESYTADQVAALLGVDVTRVRHRATAGALAQIQLGRRRYFPRWQFRDGKPLPGLAEVLAALPQPIHPLSVAAFMGNANSDLADMSPADWLATGGDPEAVVFEARSIDQW